MKVREEKSKPDSKRQILYIIANVVKCLLFLVFKDGIAHSVHCLYVRLF